jgi:hypothetical protein
MKFDRNLEVSKNYLKIHSSVLSYGGEFIYVNEGVCILQQGTRIMLTFGPNERGPLGKPCKLLLDKDGTNLSRPRS